MQAQIFIKQWKRLYFDPKKDRTSKKIGNRRGEEQITFNNMGSELCHTVVGNENGHRHQKALLPQLRPYTENLSHNLNIYMIYPKL